MLERATCSLRVARIGSFAQRFLASRRTASVAALFQRSMYLEAEADIICIGGASIGDGPLNALIDCDEGLDWLSLVGAPGAVATIEAGTVRLGALALDTARAITWAPAAWPCPGRPAAVQAAIRAVVEIASARAPAEGLARPALSPHAIAQPSTPLERVAVPRLDALVSWLEQSPRRLGQVQRDPTSQPPTALLGLGPGLTPSGDDLLCGALIALDAMARHDERAALAHTVLAHAPQATTLLSARFLAAAAEGQGHAVLHEFIAALVAGDAVALPSTMAALGRIGHSSGWDALAGAVLAVKAWAAVALQPTQSP